MKITYAEATLECPCGETQDVIWRGEVDVADIEEEVLVTAMNRGEWGREFCLRCDAMQVWQDPPRDYYD